MDPVYKIIIPKTVDAEVAVLVSVGHQVSRARDSLGLSVDMSSIQSAMAWTMHKSFTRSMYLSRVTIGNVVMGY